MASNADQLDLAEYVWSDSNHALLVGQLIPLPGSNGGSVAKEAWLTFVVKRMPKSTPEDPSLVLKAQILGLKKGKVKDNVDLNYLPAGIPSTTKAWVSVCEELWKRKSESYIKSQEQLGIAEMVAKRASTQRSTRKARTQRTEGQYTESQHAGSSNASEAEEISDYPPPTPPCGSKRSSKDMMGGGQELEHGQDKRAKLSFSDLMKKPFSSSRKTLSMPHWLHLSADLLQSNPNASISTSTIKTDLMAQLRAAADKKAILQAEVARIEAEHAAVKRAKKIALFKKAAAIQYSRGVQKIGDERLEHLAKCITLLDSLYNNKEE